ncbi:alkaline phosphatase family protein [Chitinophaga sp. Cy-1792]|uniref:alkaline phosphatase family protein n=1 Tax=Chitinophaga sp. Cy-1792 TaxID=2608339 RepID=UPI00141DF9A5|nr:alkaline phosphatase family protein [Chitinophaga sp. Cy-1792]NIG54185.1 DUF4983 domain-containing protein [Chitinophaga sp. Cy-1792]
MQKILSGYLKCGIGAAMAGMIALSACTREVLKPVRYDTDTSRQLIGTATLKDRKVLLIGIDGAVASLVESFKTPVITGLLPQSVYTFSGINDTISTPAAAWSTIMTGRTVAAHKIIDSTLIPRSVEGSHTAITYYNSFLYYIKDDNNQAKVSSISQWADLNYFTMNVADKIYNVNGGGDKTVADATVAELNSNNPDVLIANFNGPALAGLQSGFTDNAAYRKAVTDVDTYIGSILAALKARKNAAKEDWLVVIQNTSGGTGNQMGGASVGDRNNMTIYYSPLITPQRLDGPAYYDLGVRYTGGLSNYIRAENYDGGLYNLGSGELTIEAKVRFNKGPRNNYRYQYPPFLSKCDSLDDVIPGWAFYRDNDDIAFTFQDGINADEVRPAASIADGNFHTITATLQHTYSAAHGHGYTASIFVDGQAKQSESFDGGAPEIVTESPLVIGYRPVIYNDNNEIDMYMMDVRIWNKVLPDDVIKKYAPLSNIDATHPYYANLIGDWRGNDHGGNVLHDNSSYKKDFKVVGKYRWDALGYVLDGKSATTAPSNIDIFPSVLSWIGISLPASTMPTGINRIQVIGTK